MTADYRTPRTIPYITLREEEHDLSLPDLCVRRYGRGERLAYRDEKRQDRDHNQVLYARTAQVLGPEGRPAGRPVWDLAHPGRQRECWNDGLCHVCGHEVADGQPAFLFVESVSPRLRRQPGWPEGHITCQPTVCLEHAADAAGLGPHLTPNQRVALLARSPRWYGVVGTPYQYDSGGARLRRAPTPDGRGELLLPFDDPRLDFVLGLRLAVVLHDVTEVDLDDARTAAGFA